MALAEWWEEETSKPANQINSIKLFVPNAQKKAFTDVKHEKGNRAKPR